MNNWQILIIMAFRYLIFAGGFYLFFYVFFKNKWLHRKIQAKFPLPKQLWSEIAYSTIAILIFTTVAIVVFTLPNYGYSKIYKDINEYSIWYFWLSVVLIIFLHDFYFYCIHRLMHTKFLFRYVHAVHHNSHNPTPWSAFAFHPLEAVMEAGILPLSVFLFPLHEYAIALFMLYMIVMNVLGHLGFELYSTRFLQRKITSWMNTSTHHNMHHKYSKCNYGLYFNIWDSLFKTNHENYKKEFEAVTSRAK